jgi:hypothetical protein
MKISAKEIPDDKKWELRGTILKTIFIGGNIIYSNCQFASKKTHTLITIEIGFLPDKIIEHY